MTEKRYYAHKYLINEDKVHDKICHRFMNISETVEHMNMYYQKYTALKKENEQLKQQNKELKIDNDIKFWKHQFMMNHNTTQLIMHELAKAIDEGYEVSEEFQKYSHALEVRNSKNREKMERLGI